MIGQFSSIGSLGNDKDRWLCSEWLQSLSTCSGNMMSSPPLHLVSMFLNLHYGWKLNTDLILIQVCKFFVLDQNIVEIFFFLIHHVLLAGFSNSGQCEVQFGRLPRYKI